MDFFDKKSDGTTTGSEEFEKKGNNQKPQNQKPVVKAKERYKIVLITKTYIVVSVGGNNQFVQGIFEGKKVGEMIELTL